MTGAGYGKVSFQRWHFVRTLQDEIDTAKHRDGKILLAEGIACEKLRGWKLNDVC